MCKESFWEKMFTGDRGFAFFLISLAAMVLIALVASFYFDYKKAAHMADKGYVQQVIHREGRQTHVIWVRGEQ